MQVLFFSNIHRFLGELARVIARWNLQSDEWLDAHLMVKLLIGLALGAGIVGGIVWFIVLHTHPLDIDGIAYLLISATIAYTWWAILMYRISLGVYDEEEEDEG